MSDNTVLYYITENGKNFIIANEKNILERIKNAENINTFIEWEEYSSYLIKNLIKQNEKLNKNKN